MADSVFALNFAKGHGMAAERQAEALTRGLGSTRITLRIADPSSGDISSQLGLEPPTAEDVQIYPAVVQLRAPGPAGQRRIQAIVSSKAIRPIAAQYGIEDIATWLLTAEGLRYRGKLLRIETVVSDQFAETEYLYHIMATE